MTQHSLTTCLRIHTAKCSSLMSRLKITFQGWIFVRAAVFTYGGSSSQTFKKLVCALIFKLSSIVALSTQSICWQPAGPSPSPGSYRPLVLAARPPWGNSFHSPHGPWRLRTSFVSAFPSCTGNVPAPLSSVCPLSSTAPRNLALRGWGGAAGSATDEGAASHLCRWARSEFYKTSTWTVMDFKLKAAVCVPYIFSPRYWKAKSTIC